MCSIEDLLATSASCLGTIKLNKYIICVRKKINGISYKVNYWAMITTFGTRTKMVKGTRDISTKIEHKMIS